MNWLKKVAAKVHTQPVAFWKKPGETYYTNNHVGVTAHMVVVYFYSDMRVAAEALFTPCHETLKETDL